MARITPYLFFDGKCRDAMNFYKECFGGDLHMQAVGETPAVEQMPAETRQKIMHAARDRRGFSPHGLRLDEPVGTLAGQ